MRIVHLLKHAVRGNGSVHVAVDLACAQADRGHEVWFVSARGSYDDLLRAHGVHVHDVTEATSATTALRSLREQLALARRVKPDVLHAHMMSSAALAAVVAPLSGSTLITTMHNSFDGHSWLMRLGRRVIAVSDAERRLLLERGYPARKVVTVLNGTGGSPREDLPFDDIGPLQRPSVMTLCGLHPRKAVNDVIDGFARVATEFPDWHLNIVGWGAERDHLEAQSQRLGIAGSVHFLGTTLTPIPLLEESEIFAHAALADPCPLTVMEARTAGCAVIGTDVGGIPEVLGGGAAGRLVPPKDPDAIAAAMRELMGDPATLAEWRARAKQGSEYFSVQRVADDHDVVYASVARTASRQRRPLSGVAA
jgi:glycosyltransferase involved in cell wall biosynthesis